MLNVKGFTESDGQVNPVLDPGRYYGIIKKVEIRPWKSGKGNMLKVQFVAEQPVNEDQEMPRWAKNGAYVFHDISLPDADEYADNPDWVQSCADQVKNLYMACGVEPEDDDLDPENELVGQQVIGMVGIDRGGEKDGRYVSQHNIIKEFLRIPE